MRRRTLGALAAVQTYGDLEQVVERNGTAEATVEAKSQEWLEENGTLWNVYILSRHGMLIRLKFTLPLLSFQNIQKNLQDSAWIISLLQVHRTSRPGRTFQANIAEG